jgi:DNA-binding NtrC family response regulator
VIRVLVVDDESSIRNSLVAFLEDVDFELSSVGSAEEAFESIQDANRRRRQYHVVIVDLRLPGMSGEMLIIRAHELFPTIRFLIHTGSTSYRLPEEMKRIGMRPEHVFLKPVGDLAVFASAIRSLMKGEA